MEHHSNHTSWLETIATVEIIPPNEDGLVDLESLEDSAGKIQGQDDQDRLGHCLLQRDRYIHTLLSNRPDDAQSRRFYCFVDFACAAPYFEMDMHPELEGADLDAIFFSPHKFLGGPGSAGVLVFNKELYHQKIPDNPGGGTVDWTNPWGGHQVYR